MCYTSYIQNHAPVVGTRERFILALLFCGLLAARLCHTGIVWVEEGYPTAAAIQILDGVANAIFGIVSVLVIKDRTQGTGRFNIAAGALATMVGVGAALSMSIGGILIQRLGYRASFLGLSGIALAAFLMLWWLIPETLVSNGSSSQAGTELGTVDERKAFAQ